VKSHCSLPDGGPDWFRGASLPNQTPVW
jgi:hypothetical protein